VKVPPPERQGPKRSRPAAEDQPAAEGQPPEDIDAGVDAMGAAVWGKWPWFVSAVVAVAAAVLFATGPLKALNAGFVSFSVVLAAFSTRYVFSPDQVLASSKISAIIGTKNPRTARIVLALCALLGWGALLASLADAFLFPRR
jgi:hypothetical protein